MGMLVQLIKGVRQIFNPLLSEALLNLCGAQTIIGGLSSYFPVTERIP
jgi:hypothetical protein